MAHEHYALCIEACQHCADACDHCATACLHEQDVAPLARCIALDVDCAQLCRLAAGLMARDSENAPLLCGTCATLCERCADECEKHAHMAHCKACAEACRRCAEECHRMEVGQGRATRSAAARGAQRAHH